MQASPHTESRDDQDFGPFSSVLTLSGQAFLQALCDTALAEFGPQVVLIGSLRVAEADRLFIEAIAKHRHEVDLEFYDICAAPCKEVLREQRTIIHLERLNDLYPEDPGIRIFESRSYVGCPLIDAHGASSGIFVMEWNRSLDARQAERISRLLEAVAQRIAVELSHQIRRKTLKALLEPDNLRDDGDLFQTIALQAAEIAQLKCAFIAKCVDQNPAHFTAMAWVTDGQIDESRMGKAMNFHSSPCDLLRDQETALVKHGLSKRFPGSAYYRENKLESYFAFGFRDAAGELIGHMAFFHDRPITSRIAKSPILRLIAQRARQELIRHNTENQNRALQEALLVRKKLESLGLMAGTIAHDFNNHLTSIIGHTELAMIELEQTHPAASALAVAEDSMWQARDVIAELMDFAGGTPKSRVELLDLNHQVQKWASGYKPEGGLNSRFICDLAPNLPPIAGRATHVQQLLGNLVMNAVEALGDAGGTVIIRTALTEIAQEDRVKCLTGNAEELSGPQILLEVSDNGPGMSAELAARVFDPFFSTKDKNRGLGLAGVLGIARRMDASLVLSSQRELGTSLRLYFSAAPEAAFVPAENTGNFTESRPSADKGPVLVVDDERNVLQTLARQIRQLGYRTISAESGADAIQQAREVKSLRAAVIDVMMPGMNGWETLDRLRELDPGMPAIVITGFNGGPGSEPHPSPERVCFLSKPFRMSALQSCLEEIQTM